MTTVSATAQGAWDEFQAISRRARETGRDLTGADLDERDRLLEIIKAGTIRSLPISRSAGGLDAESGHIRAVTNPGFARFLKTGDVSEMRMSSDREFRAQGVGTGSAGGFLVPAGFRQAIIETLARFGGVREVASHVDTDTGASLPWPTVNDTANVGAILAENTQVTEQDVVLGTATLGAHMYTSKMVRVSLQLIQDSGFDVEEWLRVRLSRRIWRIQNTHFTTGTGTAQPLGIGTSPVTGVTAASATAVTYDELVNLETSVDPDYVAGDDVGWMMNLSTFGAIRKLKDTTNKPLVEPDVQAGAPRMLLGHRVYLNQALPNMAVSTKPILFGNFRAGYVTRDAGDMTILRLAERYADFLQVGFLAFLRSDGAVQDASAYKSLVMAAA